MSQKEKTNNTTINESKARLKRGRLAGSKVKNSQKRNGASINDGPKEKTESLEKLVKL